MDDEFKKDVIANQKLAFKKKTNKIKKNILNSIVKELKNFFKKNYWKILFNYQYYIKTFIYLISKKNNILINKISILVPSRGRSKKLDRFLKTLDLKTNKKSRIEFLILLDNDEPELKDYEF